MDPEIEVEIIVHPIVWLASLGAWGTYGLAVHQLGFVRGSLVWVGVVGAGVTLFGAWLRRTEQEIRRRQRYEADVIARMEADWSNSERNP